MVNLISFMSSSNAVHFENSNRNKSKDVSREF
jgi:hypothetical protein